jgi:pyruvate kinase
LKSKNNKTPVIAKIEKKEAVDNFEEILKAADGIMVARGDLGVEMPPEDVPIIQKKIIRESNSIGKLVITATQMFESMIYNPVPTRAEASDVANAVWDGTDVVMLSSETSIGKYPVEAVKIMNKILIKTEAEQNYRCSTHYTVPENLADNLFDSIGLAVANIAEQVKAACIVVFTNHGRKARVIAKFKPASPIIAISNNFDTLNFLNLHWGIFPYFMEDFSDEDKAIKAAKEIIKEKSLVKEGDVVIFTSGAPYTEKGRKSWLRFIVV